LLNSSSLRKASGPAMPSSASIKNKFWRNLPKTEDVRAGRCQRFAKQILKKERETASPKSQAHRPQSDSKVKEFPDNAGQVTFENARKKGYAFGSTYEKKPLDQNNKTKMKSSLKIRTDLTMDNAPVAPNKNLNTSGVNEFLKPTSDVSPHTKLDPIDVYSAWPFAYGSPAYGYLESFFRTDLDFLSWEREYLRSRVRTDLPAVEGRNDRRVRSLSCSSSPYLQLKSYLPPPPPEDSTSALPYGDYVVGCELPSLSFGDMCPHPDLPLAMAEGTNVVTDTSDPLFTLDYMVESSLKFNLLLAELPLVLARADAFGDLARDTICQLEAKSVNLERQTTTLKLRIAKVVEESDQAMSRSNGFSKYPGSEIAVFWQRLNDWVEHLARQYVLFGRELEWTIHDFVPPEVGRDALTPFNTGNIARQCLTGFFSIPSGSNQSLGNMVTSYLDSCYNEVRQMSPDIAAKFNAAVHRIREIGSRYNIDVEKYMKHPSPGSWITWSVDHLSEFKSKMYDWSGRLGLTNPGNGANTSTESTLNSTGGSGSPSDSSVISVEEDGNKLEWEEQPSPPSPLTPLTPQRPPPAFFHLMTDRQIRRFVQLEGNPVSTSSSPSHSPPKM